LAQIVDALDQRIHSYFIFMVAVLLGSRSGETIALVDDEDGPAMLACGLHHLLEGIGDKGPHLAHHATAANAVAELKEDRVLATRLCHQPIGHALGHCRLPGPDIPMENDERILLGNQIAKREPAAMMLLVPARQLAQVEQKAKLVMNAGVARIESQQDLFSTRQSVIWKGHFAIEDRSLTHAAQSFRCIP
jgi:hypothetical protein